jgi:RNA polymerase sigma-70 factor (ECF subfamily)
VDLDAPFFRREAARLVAALTRAFGVENVALAEDVAQETLARAFEAWSYGGAPEHASALLMTAAKNRALDAFRRDRTAYKLAPDLARFVESEWTLRATVDELFLPDALKDDELRMMFSCCHPQLHEDVQVALILNLLCGFSVGEVASAFLVTPAAMEKRLSRGKQVLARSKRLFELTAEDFAPRLEAVHRALYLLFNEGYHGASAEAVVREELCQEAMRLVLLLVRHAPAATPATRALAALMFLGAARLPGRVDEAGNLKGLFEQDRSCWDRALLDEGLALLDESASGVELSVYHVEAGIGALHATAPSAAETRWDEIVHLYDVLMGLRPSPVVALNRAMAVAQRDGPESGLDALRSLESAERLARYPFHAAALGELELRAGRPRAAQTHFFVAKGLARNDGERRFLEQRIVECARLLDELTD